MQRLQPEHQLVPCRSHPRAQYFGCRRRPQHAPHLSRSVQEPQRPQEFQEPARLARKVTQPLLFPARTIRLGNPARSPDDQLPGKPWAPFGELSEKQPHRSRAKDRQSAPRNHNSSFKLTHPPGQETQCWGSASE
jgi:hypothetical protein